MVIAKKIEKYNYDSFKEWKTAQGDSYEETISSLRWEIDFKRDTQKNLKLIEDWFNKDVWFLSLENKIQSLQILFLFQQRGSSVSFK